MKFLVVLSSVVACAFSQVLLYNSPYVGSPYAHYAAPYATPYINPYVSPVVATPYITSVSSQFRAQDELGQFTFATAGDNQARAETKTLDGAVRGAYSYVDPNGKLINVHYHADDNGFRVIGANNLPEAVAAPEVPQLKGPEPVQDTPEVVAARAEFQKKYDEAAKAAEASPDTPVSRRRRQILLPSLAAPHYYHVAPAVAKHTVKVQQFEHVDAAVPADTKKIELKEKEHEVLVPAYAAPQVIAAPHAIPVAHAVSPQIVPAIAAPHYYSVAPAVAKHTVKVHQYEPVDAAVPADTKKIELKEKEHQVVVPAYPYVHHGVIVA